MEIISNDILIQWFFNISLLMMLLLLYIFIPDNYVINKKIPYSLFVGVIFSFAAIFPTILDWTISLHFNVGINSILIPLAGFFGGPVSAGIISVIILLFTIILEGRVGVANQIVIISASFIIGSLFYHVHKRRILRISPTGMIALLSLFVGLIPTAVLIFLFPSTSPPDSTVQIALLVIVGVFLLGNIILFIDRKRESDYELIVYKDHLEALVQERTTDLEKVNALHKSTLESTTDGIVVVDFNGIIQNYNTAATRILGTDPGKIAHGNLNIYEILKKLIIYPGFSDIDYQKNLLQAQESIMDVTFQTREIYEIRITPHQLYGKVIGNVINFRDITERRHAEEALQAVNQKLVLLSGITRHDILNQLTALQLYLTMLLDEVTDSTIIEHLKKVNQVSDVMKLQVEFTRDYQDLGLNAPVWVNLKDTFLKSTVLFKDQNLDFSFFGINYEIYSDPILERVFYNLIDNSLRHGDHVSSIRITTELTNEGMIIRYSDNGTGVEPRYKQKIFEKGFGKNTGFGLFLIYEILSITGMSIKETGTWGTGVQFDIVVPAGKFRELRSPTPDSS